MGTFGLVTGGLALAVLVIGYLAGLYLSAAVARMVLQPLLIITVVACAMTLNDEAAPSGWAYDHPFYAMGLAIATTVAVYSAGVWAGWSRDRSSKQQHIMRSTYPVARVRPEVASDPSRPIQTGRSQ